PKTLAGPRVSEALGVPSVLSLPLPYFTPTAAYPLPFFGAATFGPWGNRATYAFTRAGGVMYGRMIDDLRRELARGRSRRLPDPPRNADGTRAHVLYPYSRLVVPVPADYPDTAHVTGYWFLDGRPVREPPA